MNDPPGIPALSGYQRGTPYTGSQPYDGIHPRTEQGTGSALRAQGDKGTGISAKMRCLMCMCT